MQIRPRPAIIAALAAVCAVLGLSTAAPGESARSAVGAAAAAEHQVAGLGTTSADAAAAGTGAGAHTVRADATDPASGPNAGPTRASAARVDVLRDTRPHPYITAVSPGAGAVGGGQIVTVYGRNLTSADGVLFGDTPARDLHVVSAFRLTVRVPAHSAAGVDVRLEQGNWLSGVTAVDRYDYVKPTAAPAWGRPTTVDTFHDATMRVSCTGATFCGVAEPHDLFTLVNGQKHDPSVALPIAQTIDAIDCAAVEECVAIGHTDAAAGLAAVLHNGSWTLSTPAAIPGGPYVWSLSCGSTQSCWAVAASTGQRVQWNGTTWTADSTVPISAAVSCVSDTFCMMVAREFAQTWDGTTWGERTAPRFIPTAVSCASVDTCEVATTGDPWRWTGQTWSAEPAGGEQPHHAQVQCTSAQDCVAITYPYSSAHAPFASWRRDQSGWRRTGAVDPSLRALSLSCWADGACVAGLDGVTATLSNDTWSRSTRIDLSTTKLSSISCPQASDCVSADGKGNVLYSHNGVWTSPAPPAGSVEKVPAPITCGSLTSCYGPGVHYDGSIWSAQRFIPGGPGWRLERCTSPSFCIATSYQNAYSIWNGTSWSAESLLPLGTDVYPATPYCPVVGVCYLLYPNGAFYSHRGTDWVRYPATAAAAPGGSAITCSGIDFCLTVSGASSSQIFHRGRWWSTGSALRAHLVDCRAVNDCLSATTANAIMHWNGLTWQEVRPGGTAYPTVVTHRGSTWVVAYSDGTVVEGV